MATQTTRLRRLDGGDDIHLATPALESLTEGVQRPRDTIDVRRKRVCDDENPHGHMNNVFADSSACPAGQPGKRDVIDTI
jgi:hypothetical protein